MRAFRNNESDFSRTLFCSGETLLFTNPPLLLGFFATSPDAESLALSSRPKPPRKSCFIPKCAIDAENQLLTDLPIAHLDQAVAVGGKAAVVGCHYQCDAVDAREFQQQVEDLATGALVQ